MDEQTISVRIVVLPLYVGACFCRHRRRQAHRPLPEHFISTSRQKNLRLTAHVPAEAGTYIGGKTT
jgi:hypothetical protein